MVTYRIVKSSTHTGLEEEINKAAVDGWEPIIRLRLEYCTEHCRSRRPAAAF